MKGAQLIPSFGLRVSSGFYEYVPLGVFTINQASWGASGVEITAYDNMAKFDRSFSTSTLFGTPYELTRLACESCNVELGMRKDEFSSFTNGAEKITLYADNDIQSWRDVISWIAQTIAANALINRQGQLYFRSYDRTVVDALDDTQRFTGASFGDYETRYSGLSCVNIEAQTTSYYGEETDDALTYNLGSNPFLQTEVTLSVDEMRRNILTAIQQIRYVPFKADLIGNPAYDLMDCFCFSGGIADETKISCMTKYTFKFNGTYTMQGVGQNPELISAKSKSDKNLAGIMATVESITSSINHLIYDYNTGPLTIAQQEETVAMLSFYVSQTTDIEGHFLMDYEADQSTHMTIRFYDTNVEELYSPVEVDVLEGRGTIGIPHSFLHRELGIHSVFVTVQCTLGTVDIDTRGVFLTINAGNFATAVDEIGMDVIDISMRQLLESNGPDEIWTVGIEQDNLIASKRPYNITPGTRVEWTGVYTPGKAKTAAIEFDGEWMLKTGAEKYTIQTEDQPWYFWVDMEDNLIAQHGDNESLRLVLDEHVSKVSACRGYSSMLYPEQDQGLIVAYIKENKAYYRALIYNTQTDRKEWNASVPLEETEQWDDVRVHRLNDYRIAFTMSNADHNVWLISERTYVGQSAYPERLKQHDDLEWVGISVTGEETSYDGIPRVLPEDGEPQDHFYVDFPFDAFLWNRLTGEKQPVVTVNGTALSQGKYELSTDGNVLLLETEEAIAPQKNDDAHVALLMRGFSHYLRGNGINYMFDTDTTYEWIIKRLIKIVRGYEFEHMAQAYALSASVRVIPITDKTASGNKESLSFQNRLSAILLVKPVNDLTSPLMKESTGFLYATVCTIDVQLTGASPI